MQKFMNFFFTYGIGMEMVLSCLDIKSQLNNETINKIKKK